VILTSRPLGGFDATCHNIHARRFSSAHVKHIRLQVRVSRHRVAKFRTMSLSKSKAVERKTLR